MLAIVDYKAGNLTSVKLALETIGVAGVVTSDPAAVKNADRVIFPGVGAAESAMKNLKHFGLDKALRDFIQTGKPLLGICVGMQVLLSFSEEDGGVAMLDFIPGKVVRFRSADPWDKVPQIGWNDVHFQESKKQSTFFRGVPDGSDFYFVHSYYPVPANTEHTAATTNYGGTTFTSVIHKDNIVATQFHPEKSGRFGLQLLHNFTEM